MYLRTFIHFCFQFHRRRVIQIRDTCETTITWHQKARRMHPHDATPFNVANHLAYVVGALFPVSLMSKFYCFVFVVQALFPIALSVLKIMNHNRESTHKQRHSETICKQRSKRKHTHRNNSWLFRLDCIASDRFAKLSHVKALALPSKATFSNSA